MSKWYSFTQNGKPRFVNESAIEWIDYNELGCWLHTTSGKSLPIDQSINEIPFLPLGAKQYGNVEEMMSPDTRLIDLEFSTRAENIFQRNRLETISDLLAFFAHENKFKTVRGAGQKTKQEIVSKMNCCGYHFVWEGEK